MSPSLPQILLVDDQPANLDLLGRLLRSHGYPVRVAPSGRMALESARLSPPGAILLDIGMPDMDGYETCRQLKAIQGLESVPVIFISALDQALDKAKAFEVGGCDYIPKPFQELEVLVRLGHHLERRRLEEELAKQNEALQSANLHLLELDRMRQAFTAMVVHDLRSPLSGIKSLLDLCEDERPLPRELHHAGKRSMQGLFRMIDDLLELMKGDTQDLVVQPIEIPLEARLASLMRLHTPEAQARGLELRWEIAAGTPSLNADSDLLDRAIGNLLANAMKFTPRGGKVTLEAELREGTGIESGLSWVLIRVRDSGRGIPPEALPFVFDPFRQVERGDRHSGVGLGLAIVQRIMAAHQGRASVRSQLGEGTEFLLLFPHPKAPA